jgi:hypothetical protein
MIVIERIADQTGASDNSVPRTTTRPTRMVSSDPISDYMRQHGCSFPDALEALAAQLGPPTAHDVRRALQTLGRAGAPVDLLEALEAWSDNQMQQAARSPHRRADPPSVTCLGRRCCHHFRQE